MIRGLPCGLYLLAKAIVSGALKSEGGRTADVYSTISTPICRDLGYAYTAFNL